MKATELCVISSKEIKNPSQLREVFRDKCGVQIDDMVYTSAESILKVGQVLEDLTKVEVDNELATTEFTGMWAMALSIADPERYRSEMQQMIKENGEDMSIEEAENEWLKELEEERNHG